MPNSFQRAVEKVCITPHMPKQKHAYIKNDNPNVDLCCFARWLVSGRWRSHQGTRSTSRSCGGSRRLKSWSWASLGRPGFSMRFFRAGCETSIIEANIYLPGFSFGFTHLDNYWIPLSERNMEVGQGAFERLIFSALLVGLDDWPAISLPDFLLLYLSWQLASLYFSSY